MATQLGALYKVLNEDGTCCNGGTGAWNLPTQKPDGSWKPGKWMTPIVGDLIPCQHGYHLCREEDLVHWLGPAIWEAESKGKTLIHEGNKIAVRQARLLKRIDTWTERTARLFAADCAESVLHLFEDKHPDDDRPRKAIEAARLYANGHPGDAARAAAGDAAWSAAGDAAWSAAGDAAWSAAKAATGAAAGYAAWSAAKAAAWDAAWAATGAAAYAARDTARAAAGYAARAAAYAARAAAGKKQTALLMEYLRGEKP